LICVKDDAPENAARCADSVWAFCEPVATLLLDGKTGATPSRTRNTLAEA
jgi:hypothetical protein